MPLNHQYLRSLTARRFLLHIVIVGIALTSTGALAQPALVGELVSVDAGSTDNIISFDYLGSDSGAITGQVEFSFSDDEFQVTNITCYLPGCTANERSRRMAFFTFSEVADQDDAIVITFDVSSAAAVGVYAVTFDMEQYASLAGSIPPEGSVEGSIDVSRAPIARDDLFSVDEDGAAITGNLRQNNGSGADEVGDPPFVYSLTSAAELGQLTLNGQTGDISYLPLPNRNGVEMVTYEITDSDNETSGIGVVTIMINAVPDPRDDLLLLDKDGGLSNVFVTSDNGSGADDTGDGLSQVTVTTPPGNAVEFDLANDGNVHYVPDQSFTVMDSFGYTLTDTDGDVGPEATVIVLLDPVFDGSFESTEPSAEAIAR